MVEQASSFVQNWTASNLRNDPRQRERGLAEWAMVEIGRLKDSARAAGLGLNEPELDDDLLRDEIIAAIKRIAEIG